MAGVLQDCPACGARGVRLVGDFTVTPPRVSCIQCNGVPLTRTETVRRPIVPAAGDGARREP